MVVTAGDNKASACQDCKATGAKEAHIGANSSDSKSATAKTLGSQMVNAVTLQKDSQGHPVKSGAEASDVPAELQPAQGGPHQVGKQVPKGSGRIET